MAFSGYSDYLYIHKKWYNIKDFKHPGGPVSIGLGRGRDATALFESHHPFTSKAKLRGLLAKYEVPAEQVKELNLTTLDSKSKKAPKPEDLFDWGEGGIDRKPTAFEKELMEEVTSYFKNEAEKRGVSLLQATKATPHRWSVMISLLIMALFSVYHLTQGAWWALIVAPVLCWLLSANTCHDAMHFSLSTDWRINAIAGYFAPWTSSPLMWYHQHVIGHHAYPNVGHMDPDIAHAPGFIRVHESVEWKPAHRFQMYSNAVIWTLGATLYMTVVPFKTLWKGSFNRTVFLGISKSRLVRHILGRIIIACSLWLWPWFVFPIWKSIIFCTIPMFIHSMCFMTSTQFNHLTPQNSRSLDKNFYKHQVVTSHSFAPYSRFAFYLTGGLNLQIEHHLFPTVNHCHLPKLHFLVKTTCAKHNVPYHESDGFGEAIRKYFEHLNDMALPSITKMKMA